jgi:hypothetical protein
MPIDRLFVRRAAAPLALICAAVLSAAPIFAQTAQDQKKGGIGQGIHVSGRWKIDVVNPDGTIASHHEFENAIQAGGKFTLSNFLFTPPGGAQAMGNWAVVLFTGALSVSSSGTQSVQGIVNNSFVLEQAGTTYDPMVVDYIDDGGNTFAPPACGSGLCSFSLAVTPVQGGNSFANGIVGVQLSGNTVPATQAGNIFGVATVVETCISTGGPSSPPPTPAACSTASLTSSTISKSGSTFSEVSNITQTVDAPNTNFTKIPFQQSQVLQVSVTISFQ